MDITLQNGTHNSIKIAICSFFAQKNPPCASSSTPAVFLSYKTSHLINFYSFLSAISECDVHNSYFLPPSSMISYLKGIILEKSTETATVLINGSIGYELFVPEDDLLPLKNGDEAQFFCYHHITDRSENLYGFIDRERKNLFKLLVERVSGIGPKSALRIVSKTDSEKMMALIARGDSDSLASLGIGKKTAEKITSELKEKIQMVFGISSHTGTSPISNEAEEALISLGYTKSESQAALSKINHQGKTTEAILKEALAHL